VKVPRNRRAGLVRFTYDERPAPPLLDVRDRHSLPRPQTRTVRADSYESALRLWSPFPVLLADVTTVTLHPQRPAAYIPRSDFFPSVELALPMGCSTGGRLPPRSQD